MGSAFEFPVPWSSIPANIFYCFTQIYYALTARNVRDVGAHVKRELGADVITFETLMFRPLPGQKVLVSNRPEIEFPLAVIPKHLTACGPVIRPVPSVADVDPELATWLKRGPTVFISLGTHRCMTTEDEALEMAGAIHQLLEAWKQKGSGAGVPGKLQVLWKLMTANTGETATYETGPGTRVYTLLQEALDSDRVRIVDWVKPQPSAVLQAGTVVCSINHGGANSFHDALTYVSRCLSCGSQANVLQLRYPPDCTPQLAGLLRLCKQGRDPGHRPLGQQEDHATVRGRGTWADPGRCRAGAQVAADQDEGGGAGGIVRQNARRFGSGGCYPRRD
jgi:hypothetical protein